MGKNRIDLFLDTVTNYVLRFGGFLLLSIVFCSLVFYVPVFWPFLIYASYYLVYNN